MKYRYKNAYTKLRLETDKKVGKIESVKPIDFAAVESNIAKIYAKFQKEQERRSKVRPINASLDEIKVIRESQVVCQICGKEKRLVLDHCHSTGKIRGMLCNSCNTGLGMFQDDTQRLTNAVEYLKKTI